MTRKWITRAAAAASIFLGGCSGVQSVLAPSGSGASSIALLAWLLFAIVSAILIVVMLAVWIAIRGSPSMRAKLASPQTVVMGGIVFPATLLTGLLTYGIWLTQAAVSQEPAKTRRIEVVGEQWWWRVTYAGEDRRSIASANEIRVPVGQSVEFQLKSADVIHSFWVPNLAGKVDMVPGRTTHLRVIADRPGVFRGQCAEYCGGPHALMAFEVVAMAAQDYEGWLAAQSAPAAEPLADQTTRGQAQFLSAGCGGCHTIRGTRAKGTIGPDLTHVGSRRAIAANALPLTQANLARFISDGQHIKPNNLMPPYRIFSASELEAIAAYLESLR